MQPTDAIASTQYELGLKLEVNNSFDLGMSLFDVKRDASYLNTANNFVSDGRFHHRGIELNSVARPIRNLALLGNIAYINTELNEVADLTTLGKRTEGAPQWKGTFGVRYFFESLPSLSMDANLNHTGNRAVDAQNSGFISGYTIFDAGISYNAKFGKTSALLRLNARNLTNEYYYSGVIYSGGLDVGRSREIFLSAQFKF